MYVSLGRKGIIGPLQATIPLVNYVFPHLKTRNILTEQTFVVQ